MNSSTSTYIVLVETNKYTGNFEREICAYMTGQYGDCSVGDDQAKIFVEEEGRDLREDFEEYIGQEPDDHGCYRPVSISNIDGRGYNSLEIYFDKKPTREMVELMSNRAKVYGLRNNIAVQSVKLYNKVTSTQYLEESI